MTQREMLDTVIHRELDATESELVANVSRTTIPRPRREHSIPGPGNEMGRRPSTTSTTIQRRWGTRVCRAREGSNRQGRLQDHRAYI